MFFSLIFALVFKPTAKNSESSDLIFFLLSLSLSLSWGTESIDIDTGEAHSSKAFSFCVNKGIRADRTFDFCFC